MSRLSLAAALFCALTALLAFTSPASAVSPGPRDTAVILFNFANDTSQPVTATNMRNWVFSDTDSVNNWLREDSGNTVSMRGIINSSNIDVFGWYTIAANKPAVNNAPGACVSSDTIVGWGNQVEALAASQGTSFANYEHLIFLSPQTNDNCGFRAFVDSGNPRRIFYDNDIRADLMKAVLSHEMTHALPQHVGHSNALTCMVSFVPLPISSSTNCTRVGNGDPASTVGSNDYYVLNNNWVRARLGYYPAANITTVSKAAQSTTTLRPANPILASGAGTQVLRIDRGATVDADYRWMYIEDRRANGVFDADFSTIQGSLASGIVARVAQEHNAAGGWDRQSFFLDATPWTATNWDGWMGLNQSLYDPIGNFTVTMTARTASNSSVRITPGVVGSQGTASVSGGVLRFVAASGKRNNINVTRAPGGPYTITSPYPVDGDITAGAGCADAGVGVVTCAAAGISSMRLEMGDGDDNVNVVPLVATTILGGDGQDILYGGDHNDRLEGGAGRDQLHGGNGVDVLVGGTDADDLYGEGSSDTADYSAVTTAVDANLSTGFVYAESASDRVYGIESVITGSGNDVLTGSAADDGLYSGPGADTINGGSGNDWMDGGPGGFGDVDVLSGGAGTGDTASYSARTSTVLASLNNTADDGAPFEGDNADGTTENLYGGSAPDQLYGSSGNNTLYGSGGADLLDGGAGNDSFDSGPGNAGDNDTFVGGAGTDAVSYASRGAGVTVTMNDNLANDGAPGEGDNIQTTVENITGSYYTADNITGNDSANLIDGVSGADTIRALGGNDTVQARDGLNDPVLDCGTGTDTLLADLLPLDNAVTSCETTTRG